MGRAVDRCEFREGVRPSAEGETAVCRLVLHRLGGPAPPIARGVCERCCEAPTPGFDRLNEVVASIVYLKAAQALGSGRGDPDRAAELALEEARGGLKTLWTSPNHPVWSGPVPTPRATAELIDPTVTPDTFAGLLHRGEPFAYLRYSDGEWLSILGRRGRNCDGHDFFPDTMGRELRETLAYAAALGAGGDRFYLGLHTTWMQDAIRRHLVEHGLVGSVRWIGEHLFVGHLFDLATARFLEAVRAYEGPKVLVGNESLAPVAGGLGCRHVVIPRVDCYRQIDRMTQECRASGPGLVIACAAAASECLLVRLHRGNPRGSYVDCGSLFDALTGHYSRRYTQNNQGGVIELLREHYAPIVFGRASPRIGPHET